jgi:hypothetical protein
VLDGFVLDGSELDGSDAVVGAEPFDATFDSVSFRSCAPATITPPTRSIASTRLTTTFGENARCIIWYANRTGR